MAKPLHILAFEQFQQKYDGDDKVKMFVAFGVFVESEYKWAAAESWPSDARYRHYHDCSIPHNMNMIDESADNVLREFVGDIVDGEKADFVHAALEAYKEEAAKSHGWVRGILEATGGALLWSLILLAGAIFAGRMGIDVVEVFQRAAGVH